MEEDQIVDTLSDKSRSLRKSSVKKRLEAEIQKTNSKVKEKISKKRTLSKYRRKQANAKERERMKKMNDVFETLKKVVPAESNTDKEEEKETKVSTLRSAIAYINSLKQIIEECDAGLIDMNSFQDTFTDEGDQKENNNKNKQAQKKELSTKSRVKGSKPVILDPKWTNYSEQFLGRKFSIPKDIVITQSEHATDKHVDVDDRKILVEPDPIIDNKRQDIFEVQYDVVASESEGLCKYFGENLTPLNISPLPDISSLMLLSSPEKLLTSNCSSPRDVNEVSLHISLLDDIGDSGLWTI